MRRRIPLAWLNLAHNKVRSLVAVGGVCFAVTLLFMQLGFLDSVFQTAVLVHDHLSYDLALASPNYVMLTKAGTFPRRRLSQAVAHPAVASAAPLYVNRHLWINPDTRTRRSVVVLGVDPADPVFQHPELEALTAELTQPDTVLIDRTSRPEVGRPDVGLETEFGRHRVKTAGQFALGTGFEAGLCVVSAPTFSRLFGGYPLGNVSLGLIRLRPGADPEYVAAELRGSLPGDVAVLTRSDLESREQYYWVISTSTGIIFGSGVLVAVAVGIVIIYQVLSLDVASRLSEYATLKALGYPDRFLSRVVFQQAVIFAVGSYVPGFAFSLVIYRLSVAATKLPIGMTPGRAVGVFVATLVMCWLSGGLAVKIVKRADPADLFH